MSDTSYIYVAIKIKQEAISMSNKIAFIALSYSTYEIRKRGYSPTILTMYQRRWKAVRMSKQAWKLAVIRWHTGKRTELKFKDC